jgi:hypothetical protein
MNDLQNFLGMIIGLDSDFNKRTVKMNNGTVTTYVIVNGVEFRFENSKLEQIRNRNEQ